jgi:uridine kinase
MSNKLQILITSDVIILDNKEINNCILDDIDKLSQEVFEVNILSFSNHLHDIQGLKTKINFIAVDKDWLDLKSFIPANSLLISSSKSTIKQAKDKGFKTLLNIEKESLFFPILAIFKDYQILTKILPNNIKKPFIIGIDGFGGSGKTTFSKVLNCYLKNSEVIEMDDFYMPNISWNEYDIKRLEKQVIKPFVSGNKVTYQQTEWKVNHRDIDSLSKDFFELDENTEIIILEGSYSISDEIKDLIDLKIWIETPHKEATKRGVDRELIKGGRKIEDEENGWKIWNQIHKDKIILSKSNAEVVINNLGNGFEIREKRIDHT